MMVERSAEQIMGTFQRGIFPEPHEFTDSEIQTIAKTPGIDKNGTFADAPLEQTLIRLYGLVGECGDTTWPAFATMLREEKMAHYSRFTSRD